MVSIWEALLLGSAPARALDVEVVVQPSASTLAPQRCVATGVSVGTLLSADVLVAGAAKLTPLVVAERSLDRGEVLWRTALKSQQPGLISLAYPEQGQALQACPRGRACTQAFDRQEQSLTVTVTFGGELSSLPAPAAARPTWDSASWYREAVPMTCGPLAAATP
jgi:hypothetical protein